MHTTGLMVVLAITVMLTVGIACNGPQPATLPETAIATAVPEPSPTKPSIGGATWILESIDGQPPIAGTYSTLTVNVLESFGFDGCNSFGGRHEPSITTTDFPILWLTLRIWPRASYRRRFTAVCCQVQVVLENHPSK